MNEVSTFLIKIPRGSDITPEPAQTFLAALTQMNSVTNWERLTGKVPQVMSLEIVLSEQKIRFLLTCDKDLAPFVEAQLLSNYPLALMEQIVDPLLELQAPLHVQTIGLKKGNYYPILTYPSFQDVDPLSSLLSVLAKAHPGEFVIIQFALESISGTWQSHGYGMIEKGIVEKTADGGKTRKALPDETIIKEKVSFPGFAVSVRIGASNKTTLTAIKSAFGVYNKTDGNSIGNKKYPFLARKDNFTDLQSRQVRFGDIFNIHEIATLWHLPGEKIKTGSIIWGNSVLSEAPDNLPAAMDMTEIQKNDVNFFAKTHYKNTEAVFGIHDKDRGRHIWVVGKTGTGKSTLIANMVIDDIKKGRGVGVIDPHGDLVDTVLEYIPANRINDVILFNPADREYPVVINPLEVKNKEEGELVVSGLMSVFTKIWANVWSARMEYMMRNSLMTLTEVPDATLGDVLTLMANPKYRDKVVKGIEDEALKNFWLTEYNKMPDRLQKEAIAPIQNKVGQFITSPMIRRIIGRPHSTIDLKEAMDSKKIFLANLSQGRLGEDNATLLGATLITKFQLAAMSRVDINESARVPFNLFVDEFQNFATESFVKILSEARKYRLNLMLANQYMAQIPDEVLNAILGNVGSIISFRTGADDAGILHKEFGEVFSEKDLVNLANFRIATRLMIDNHSSRPFLAGTLPLPASKNDNKNKVIEKSREQWTKKYDAEEEKKLFKTNFASNNPPNSQPAPTGSHSGRASNSNHSNRSKPAQQKTHKPFSNAFKDLKKDFKPKPPTPKKEVLFESKKN